MATITQKEKELIKGILLYHPEYTNQEIHGMINKSRGGIKNFINQGRISDVKKDGTIVAMDKEEVEQFIRKYS